MILLIYAVLSCWFVFFTYTEVVGDVILDDNVPTTLLFTMVLMYMLALTLSMVVTAFCIFHLWLIAIGKTTLEHCEKAGTRSYGASIWANYKEVFGDNIFLWLLPVKPNYKGEGVSFIKLWKEE